MAVIGIEYCDGNKSDNLGYEHVYLHTRDSKEYIFNSGDFVKDWYMCVKEYLNNYPNEFHLAHSSSVDNFIMDGAPYDEAWVLFNDNDIPYIVYECPDKTEKIRIFVKKGERPTFEEYRKFL